MNPQEAREQIKLLEQKKKLERDQQEREAMLQKLKQGEEITKRQIICGRCGMPGHMQTNRKKCLMYVAEDENQYLAEQSGYLKTESESKFTIIYENLPELPKKSMRPELISDYEKPLPKIKRSSRRQRALQESQSIEDTKKNVIKQKSQFNLQKRSIFHYFDIIIKKGSLKQGEKGVKRRISIRLKFSRRYLLNTKQRSRIQEQQS